MPAYLISQTYYKYKLDFLLKYWCDTASSWGMSEIPIAHRGCSSHVSIYNVPSIYLSINLSIYQSIYLSLSIYISLSTELIQRWGTGDHVGECCFCVYCVPSATWQHSAVVIKQLIVFEKCHFNHLAPTTNMVQLRVMGISHLTCMVDFGYSCVLRLEWSENKSEVKCSLPVCIYTVVCV